MVGADFEAGDLVWAKMKNYPFWPAKIVNPPSSTKSTPSKKAHHYVFFFGSENHAWISDENIVHHSEEMLQKSASIKKKSTSYKSAIDKITSEGEKVPMKCRTPVKEKDESEMLLESSPVSSSERKISKSQRGKSKYESAKKRYFAKVQKSSQNQYFTKMHKKVRKKYFTDRIKSSRSKETSSLENGDAALVGMLSTFAGKIVESTKKKIGFIGLGNMGQWIVRKLLDSGHNVTVWNRTFEKCKAFVDGLGAHCALKPSDVIAECDITFCCVSGPDAVKAIVFGPEGVLAGLEGTTGKGYVELTTIDPFTSEEIAEAIRHKGGTYLESPVTESRRGLSESLVVICAGDYDLFTNCESCFYAFASDAYFLSGVVGSGSNMNLLTNMFMNTVYAALAESLALIRKLNLSQDALLEFLKHGPLKCSLLQYKGENMATGKFFMGSTFKYQQKDLSLALSLGDSCEQPMPLAAAANELYKRPIHLLYEPENATSSGKSIADD